MIQTQLTIINKLGLHARAAAKFVSCTAAYSSSVRAGRDGEMVDGKSIMSIMMLAAGQGTVLDIEVDGHVVPPAALPDNPALTATSPISADS